MEYVATLNGSKDGMVCWRININGQTFDFFEGIGHFVTGGNMWKHPQEVAESIAKYIGSRGQVNTRDIASTLANFYKPTKRLPKAKWYKDTGVVYNVGPVEPPELDSVLYCLIADAEAESMSFEDWCDMFGMSTDSRKAIALYLECQETAKKLRLAKINIEAERERLQDY